MLSSSFRNSETFSISQHKTHKSMSILSTTSLNVVVSRVRNRDQMQVIVIWACGSAGALRTCKASILELCGAVLALNTCRMLHRDSWNRGLYVWPRGLQTVGAGVSRASRSYFSWFSAEAANLTLGCIRHPVLAELPWIGQGCGNSLKISRGPCPLSCDDVLIECPHGHHKRRPATDDFQLVQVVNSRSLPGIRSGHLEFCRIRTFLRRLTLAPRTPPTQAESCFELLLRGELSSGLSPTLWYIWFPTTCESMHPLTTA